MKVIAPRVLNVFTTEMSCQFGIGRLRLVRRNPVAHYMGDGVGPTVNVKVTVKGTHCPFNKSKHELSVRGLMTTLSQPFHHLDKTVKEINPLKTKRFCFI
jgi:hypothetical protein